MGFSEKNYQKEIGNMERWKEVFAGIIPKAVYQMQLINGEKQGLTIELSSGHTCVRISFGAVLAVRMLDEEIIALILDIQNNESKINLSLEEQPDLLDIRECYQKKCGEFWIALSDGEVIGTIGLMVKENACAVMKKFFVKKEYRSKKIGFALYSKLLEYARNKGVRHIILDTPSVALSEKLSVTVLLVISSFSLILIHDDFLVLTLFNNACCNCCSCYCRITNLSFTVINEKNLVKCNSIASVSTKLFNLDYIAF